MKYIGKPYLLPVIAALLIAVSSCVENEYNMLDEAKIGFRVNMYASSYVEATYDISSKELAYDSVYASVQFVIPELTSDFTVLELKKVIRNIDDEILDEYVYNEFVKADLPVDTTYYTTDADELFEGLTFPKDSLKPGYTVEFAAEMTMADGTVLNYLYGTYAIVPVLNGFCPLPYLPSGEWIAVNNNTMFTKAITISGPSPFVDEDDGRFWMSDFGLDWSTWRDVWYTIEFKLDCPGPGDPRYIVKLMPGGIYDTGMDLTAPDHTGTEVTKRVRVMPYAYGNAKITGLYDPDTRKITFENVPLVDTWWGVDNKTVNLTFTYNGD
jgi:hypothetical protein